MVVSQPLDEVLEVGESWRAPFGSPSLGPQATTAGDDHLDLKVLLAVDDDVAVSGAMTPV